MVYSEPVKITINAPGLAEVIINLMTSEIISYPTQL